MLATRPLSHSVADWAPFLAGSVTSPSLVRGFLSLSGSAKERMQETACPEPLLWAGTARGPAAVAPAAGAGCQDTGFLSFLPSELLWALSTPACFQCCPVLRLYWLARSSLAPLSRPSPWCLSPWAGFVRVAFKSN